jgi:hypothetical protein
MFETFLSFEKFLSFEMFSKTGLEGERVARPLRILEEGSRWNPEKKI